MGTIELAIPKVRPGTYFSCAGGEPLLAVVQEAYVHGVSTRKVDDGGDWLEWAADRRASHVWVDATYHAWMAA